MAWYCTFPPVAIATRVTWSRDVNVTLFAAVGSELQANDEASSDITMSGVLAILRPAAARLTALPSTAAVREPAVARHLINRARENSDGGLYLSPTLMSRTG